MKKCSLNLANGEVSLDQLNVGESGFVRTINQLTNSISPTASIDSRHSNLARRLMEIGFIPGEPLQVLHKGFFGGEPIAVRIGHSTFALRRYEAALISVISVIPAFPHSAK